MENVSRKCVCLQQKLRSLDRRAEFRSLADVNDGVSEVIFFELQSASFQSVAFQSELAQTTDPDTFMKVAMSFKAVNQ